MEQARLPRDACFGGVEDVPAREADGRIAAEMITPYPPGIPAVLPGERLTDTVVRYLRSGVEAGMNLPDAASTDLDTGRVLVEDRPVPPADG
jgi:arginine/lysine/ornithine decarboxylase